MLEEILNLIGGRICKVANACCCSSQQVPVIDDFTFYFCCRIVWLSLFTNILFV